MKSINRFIYICLFLFTILSCRKELKDSNEKLPTQSNFKAKEAIASYLKFRTGIKSSEPSNSSIKVSNLKTDNNKEVSFEIIQENPFESSTKDYSFVEFKIKIKNSVVLMHEKGTADEIQKTKDFTLNKILIKKNNKSGIIDYELISYIPSKAYLIGLSSIPENFYTKINSTFDGLILHKNIGGEIILLETVKSGGIEKKFYPFKNKSNKKVTGISTRSATDGCGQICEYTPYYDNYCNCWVDDWTCFTECSPSPYPGVSLDNGVLSFESNQAFYDLYNRLDNDVETYNANFYDPKVSLTDDQVEAIEIQQNFDEYKPLRDFETYFGFASLRQKIETEENAWMNNTTLDPSTDPDALYTEPDEVIQTFFNQSQSIKIAGVYTNTPSDYEYTTYTSGSSSSSSCKSHQRYTEPNNNHVYDNGNKSAKFVASYSGFYLGLFSTRIVARTKNFKKKSNGHWKKFATLCKARIGGYLFHNDCTNEYLWGTLPKDAKRRRSYKSSRIEFFVESKIKSGDMGGIHTVGTDGSILYFSKAFVW